MTDAAVKKIGKILIWVLVSALLLYTFYYLSDIILLVIISLLLAFIFEPFVRVLEKEGFNRFSATLIILIIVGFLIYLAFSFFIPRFVFQMNQLIATLQEYSLHDQLTKFEQSIHKFLPLFNPGDLSKRIEEFISSSILNSFDQITTLVTSIVSIAAILVIVPFITFFILKDRKKIVLAFVHTMPNKYFEISYWIIKKVGIQLGRFVRGWIFDASFVGISLGLGFFAIGIENALPLGLISGLGHLVPYFGPIIGGVPAIIISIIQFGDFSHVPWIILLILSVYALDNGFVQPYVFSKSVDMHPIIIILLILIGSQVFGIIGMLLAVPAASVIRTAIKEIYYVFKNYKIAKL